MAVTGRYPASGIVREGAAPGRVIWITGVSRSGKTTLGRALADALESPQSGAPPLLLDGDELRDVLQDYRYGADDRRRLASIYARLARLAALQRHDVIVATISLFHEIHDWNRANLPNYLEVLLRDPASPSSASGNDEGSPHVVEWPRAPDLLLAARSEDNVARVLTELQSRRAA